MPSAAALQHLRTREATNQIQAEGSGRGDSCQAIGWEWPKGCQLGKPAYENRGRATSCFGKASETNPIKPVY